MCKVVPTFVMMYPSYDWLFTKSGSFIVYNDRECSLFIKIGRIYGF